MNKNFFLIAIILLVVSAAACAPSGPVATATPAPAPGVVPTPGRLTVAVTTPDPSYTWRDVPQGQTKALPMGNVFVYLEGSVVEIRYPGKGFTVVVTGGGVPGSTLVQKQFEGWEEYRLSVPSDGSLQVGTYNGTYLAFRSLGAKVQVALDKGP